MQDGGLVNIEKNDQQHVNKKNELSHRKSHETFDLLAGIVFSQPYICLLIFYNQKIRRMLMCTELIVQCWSPSKSPIVQDKRNI